MFGAGVRFLREGRDRLGVAEGEIARFDVRSLFAERAQPAVALLGQGRLPHGWGSAEKKSNQGRHFRVDFAVGGRTITKPAVRYPFRHPRYTSLSNS